MVLIGSRLETVVVLAWEHCSGLFLANPGLPATDVCACA